VDRCGTVFFQPLVEFFPTWGGIWEGMVMLFFSKGGVNRFV
jgi:hypothetical protein